MSLAHRSSVPRAWVIALALSLPNLVYAAAAAEKPTTLQAIHFKDLSFRAIGPAVMGGRISDFAVVEKRPATFYVATGTGGLFKTTNRGTTWSAVFEKQPVASIGSVAVWQKNPEVVWVGTGEVNSRNSSSWGNGVYRSTDGGSTWSHLGLAATHNIGRVCLHPSDSTVAYVSAMGRLWGENRERGVYKTSDAGRTWQHVLEVDAKTGAIDLVMDAKNPDVLYAAMYARKRTPWSYESGGKSGGIFRTRDGGRTWKKLAGGLPAETGRIGLDVYRRDPRILLAVVESDLGGHLEDTEDQSRSGGVFRSEDGGETWQRLAPWTPRPFYFSQIRVQPTDSSRVYLCGFDLWVSDDGGRTFRARAGRNLHPDLHALWIDPADGDHVLCGTDGGLFISHDRTQNWDFINNLAIGEFYTVSTDLRKPYRVLGGLQDNQSWIGPSRSRFRPQSWLDDLGDNAIQNGEWECLGGGDGFYVQADPTDPDIVYYESQGGSLGRLNLATGRERNLRPAAKEGEPEFRFNWNAPFQISPHDPTVLWLGGNHLFRLEQRGDVWKRVSPDLTTRDPVKMATAGTAAEKHCTIVTLAESPKTKGLVWVGTDDGKVWITRDGGTTWTDLTGNLRGVPNGLYISRIEASHHDPGTAYLAIDGHRTDNYNAYALRTTDYGKSWTSILANLPKDAPVKVVREDPVNPKLLYAGTEFAFWMSLDGGRHWMKPDVLPTVAVDDIHVHPRDHDLILATHGRSLYILDDLSMFQHWSDQALRDPVTLFPPRAVEAFLYRYQSGVWGQRNFLGKNPGAGAILQYFVKEWTGDGVSLTIADSAGTTVRSLSGPGTPGFHRVTWDLQAGEPRERIGRTDVDGPIFVKPGRYSVKLKYGKAKEQKQDLRVDVPEDLVTPYP